MPRFRPLTISVRLTGCLVVTLGLYAGCADDDFGQDGPARDLSAQVTDGGQDGKSATPDLTFADLAVPDLTVVDLTVVDLTVVDLTVVDLSGDLTTPP